MSKRVYVGMSGGVDSSVTAALLLREGYDVVGVYMKNWTQSLPGFYCPWADDLADAKRVAVQLGIPFKVFDFQAEYKQFVVDYMLDEYRAGRTPNPDIMCNQEVKFKLFLDASLADGADFIATGHYARIIHHEGRNELLVGKDGNKDQSYFLYRVTDQALGKSLMPIGEYEKPKVRALAESFGLATAQKKDSQGICFVGKVGIKEFLLAELGEQASGPIVDQHGKTIGSHDGAIFYTIGQRHGLDVGGGLPYYVVGKDMQKNEVYVTTNLNDERLWHASVKIDQLHWINEPPKQGRTYKIRLRYRAPLVTVRSFYLQDGVMTIDFDDEVRAITAGQSAVLYEGECCVGGGIVIGL